jgi:two-component system, cell cycle response regulator DivK
MLKADGQLRGIPILAITAYVGKGEESHIRGVGASEYLAKPISIRPFLATVERLLGHGQEADPIGSDSSAKLRTPH